ncbi:hypothetical protein MOW08_15185 (plasmid) [Acinetobacter schindleri]|nr:hypothetical protein MOW08_15185 [Acinetobacter schindleri]
MKIALGFRYAQTLLNLAFARFVGAILVHIFVNLRKSKSKIKSSSEFASLMNFFLATLDLGIKLGKFAPMRDAL